MGASTIVNCYYKGKGDYLERGNYRELKLTGKILKIAEKIIEKLVREQVDVDEMDFGFMSGCGATSINFILRQLQEKCLANKKNEFVLCNCRFQDL